MGTLKPQRNRQYSDTVTCTVDTLDVDVWSVTFGTGWRGGLVVGRRTCDLVVAGSRPGRDAAA